MGTSNKAIPTSKAFTDDLCDDDDDEGKFKKRFISPACTISSKTEKRS